MSEPTNSSSRTKRVAVGVAGGIVLILGIIAIPYPGPGWLIVFAGLGILAQEFEWAQNLLNQLKKRYDAWQDWLKKQPLYVKAIFWLLTFAVVMATIYLLNGYGLLNKWLNLGQDWLVSPLFK